MSKSGADQALQPTTKSSHGPYSHTDAAGELWPSLVFNFDIPFNTNPLHRPEDAVLRASLFFLCV
jgi:hypothetical protein